jgi:hypothetical protein
MHGLQQSASLSLLFPAVSFAQREQQQSQQQTRAQARQDQQQRQSESRSSQGPQQQASITAHVQVTSQGQPSQELPLGFLNRGEKGVSKNLHRPRMPEDVV